MTRMKIRDRENRKILAGIRDMADFFTGNRDPIHPMVYPPKQLLIHRYTTKIPQKVAKTQMHIWDDEKMYDQL